MTTYHFGTDVDPAHYVEVPGTLDPDGSGATTAPRRPAAGTTLLVRNAATLAALPNITTGSNGYWSYTTTDVPQIQVSGDGGSTWVGPLDAAEARTSALTAAVDATTALQTANQAMSGLDAKQDTILNFATLTAAQDAVANGTLTAGALFTITDPSS